MTPTLTASINGQAVGQLSDEGGYWAFHYTESWIADGFPISPAFPLRSQKFADDGTTRRVAWFFDNLLPEEAAREVSAKEAKVTVDDAWGLLAFFGVESAGAITLLQPDSILAPSGLAPLTDAELQRRIDRLPTRSLSAGSPKRISLAGAQHKLAVTLANGALFEPRGNACSSHILKPDSKSLGHPHTAINEHFCMRLAAALKLSVPQTEVRYVPWPVYLVKRFDRITQGTGLDSIHAVDALQLLGFDRRLKYQKASAATLKACIDLCGAPLKTKQALFAWIVFNVLIGNADAHLKNVSFMVDKEGIQLAPFYDLVSTVVYATPEYDREGPHWPNVPLSMPIGQATTYADVTVHDLLLVADELELSAKPARRILDELVRRIQPKTTDLLDALPPEVTPDERRLLNLIHQLPIKEMASRLT